MIESCNIRRMLIAVCLLGGVTIVVLVFESHWAGQSSHIASSNATLSANCWDREKYDILEPCQPCSSFELASKSIEACVPTKFKEVIKCEISGKKFRSCEKVTWIEEKHYWIFEAVMFAVAVMSGCVSYMRQRILDRRVRVRIQKQLASGLAN